MTARPELAPAAAPTAPTSFHDLMAGVGYLLFQWSEVERSLDEEVSTLRRAAGNLAAGPGRARTINERLGEWRALLGRGRRRNPEHDASIDALAERIQEFCRLRNLVATGLVTAAMEGAEPVIRCAPVMIRHGTPDEVSLGLPDLLGAIEAMEQARTELALLRDRVTG